MSELPTITFGIPVLNAEEHLDRCLSSIMSQDYPKDKVEVIVADGGSTDRTLDIVKKHGLDAVHNTKKLADFGIKLAAARARGEIFVIFAADNELHSKDWLATVAQAYTLHPDLACTWCDMIAGSSDPQINRYYELIKSDPFMFLVNKNLQAYVSQSRKEGVNGHDFYFFDVQTSRPLVWGANGLSYRTDYVRHILTRDEFIGDNDVFQMMVEEGHAKVGFSPTLKVEHHHLKSLSHWVSKWRRNYQNHMISQIQSRNMKWAVVKNFKLKAALWLVYSIIPVFSGCHACYLALRDRNAYWLYHPAASFMQAYYLLRMTFETREGRRLIRTGLDKPGVQTA